MKLQRLIIFNIFSHRFSSGSHQVDLPILQEQYSRVGGETCGTVHQHIDRHAWIRRCRHQKRNHLHRIQRNGRSTQLVCMHTLVSPNTFFYITTACTCHHFCSQFVCAMSPLSSTSFPTCICTHSLMQSLTHSLTQSFNQSITHALAHMHTNMRIRIQDH